MACSSADGLEHAGVVATDVGAHVTSGSLETALQTHDSMASVDVDEDAYDKPTSFVEVASPTKAPIPAPTETWTSSWNFRFASCIKT